MTKLNNQAGYISRTLIILAVVVLLAIVFVYGVLKFGGIKKAQKAEAEKAAQEPPKPIYETTIGDVRFLSESAVDLGPIIKAEKSYQEDLITTEKFVKVTVRAQNKAKVDTMPYTWDIANIVDADGRNFVEDPNAFYFLPKPNLCGAVLKPEFEPTPCVKIYQVSKVSTHLKVVVWTTPANSSKKQESVIDLDVR